MRDPITRRRYQVFRDTLVSYNHWTCDRQQLLYCSSRVFFFSCTASWNSCAASRIPSRPLTGVAVASKSSLRKKNCVQTFLGCGPSWATPLSPILWPRRNPRVQTRRRGSEALEPTRREPAYSDYLN
jgi:hypothetical protein